MAVAPKAQTVHGLLQHQTAAQKSQMPHTAAGVFCLKQRDDSRHMQKSTAIMKEEIKVTTIMLFYTKSQEVYPTRIMSHLATRTK